MKKSATKSRPFTDFNPDNVAFGERLKVARRFAGFKTGKAFAAELGLNYLTYNNYERGRNGLKDSDLLNKMCKLAGVSNAWLKTGRGQPVEGDPAQNEAFCAMLKPTTAPVRSEVNEELLVGVFEEVSQLPQAKTMAENTKLRLAIKAYQYLMDMEGEMSDADRKKLVKGAAKLAVDIAGHNKAG